MLTLEPGKNYWCILPCTTPAHLHHTEREFCEPWEGTFQPLEQEEQMIDSRKPRGRPPLGRLINVRPGNIAERIDAVEEWMLLSGMIQLDQLSAQQAYVGAMSSRVEGLIRKAASYVPPLQASLETLMQLVRDDTINQLRKEGKLKE